jgi:hypothetical protein
MITVRVVAKFAYRLRVFEVAWMWVFLELDAGRIICFRVSDKSSSFIKKHVCIV